MWFGLFSLSLLVGNLDYYLVVAHKLYDCLKKLSLNWNSHRFNSRNNRFLIAIY